MTRVAILEDQVILRESLAALLTAAGFQVTHYAEPLSFLSRLPADAPDVAVVDVGLRTSAPEFHGLEVVRRLRDEHPEVKSIVYSGLEDPTLADRAYSSGASAFVDKLSVGGASLIQVVKAVSQGERVFPLGPGQLTAPAPPRDSRPSQIREITPRELEVLEWVAAGADNLKIAAQLHISERTVKAHVSALYRKVCADNRTQLALHALKLGVRPRDR